MTDGQRVYEHNYPKYIKVRRDRFSAPEYVVNPEHHVGWRFLTARCRESWERFAIGHHLVTNQRLS